MFQFAACLDNCGSGHDREIREFRRRASKYEWLSTECEIGECCGKVPWERETLCRWQAEIRWDGRQQATGFRREVSWGHAEHGIKRSRWEVQPGHSLAPAD